MAEKLDDVRVHIFLNLLREYSLLHIKVLQYFCKDHIKHQGAMPLNQFAPLSQEQCIIDIIQESESTLVTDIALLKIVVHELYEDGLLKISNIDQLYSMKRPGFNKCTETLGDEFLAFIE